VSGEGRDDFESSEAQRYFRRVEDVFIELRGAPLLLSPQDWHIARGWYERGIPLEIVEGALRDLFEKRRAREIDARVHSLSYCASAVDEAFRMVEELQAPGYRAPESGGPQERAAERPEEGPRELDLPARLSKLATAVEEAEVSGGASWGDRIRSLRGDAEAIENGLARLEVELVDLVAADLGPEQRAELEVDLARGLTRVGERLGADERERVVQLLRTRWLRREVGLPVLSLFSDAAAPTD
jgi:hypothetical protein